MRGWAVKRVVLASLYCRSGTVPCAMHDSTTWNLERTARAKKKEGSLATRIAIVLPYYRSTTVPCAISPATCTPVTGNNTEK